MRVRWQVPLYVLVSLYCLYAVYPIVWMIGSALKSIVEMLTKPFQLPAEPQCFRQRRYLSRRRYLERICASPDYY